MNTITITERDFNEKLIGYKGEKYFENFIFNEFRIMFKKDDCKIVYKVYINENVNEVTYRMIKNGSYRECKMKFKEYEEGWEFIENPNGELINDYARNMIDKYGESVSNESIVKTIQKWINAEVGFIILLKQYIMNESYKRVTIQKEGCKTEKSGSDQPKKKGRARKSVVQFLLGDIVEYVNRNRREFNITCECWNVRGHFRHYKNGKIVWVAEYEKGKKRNTNSHVAEHVYSI
jgi:hypothetical protein